ncbi:hypothetical protein PS2_215 [Serratia phage PS2]|uniref:Uncharacterized protein n=1 Tax=Serratia phage PS2 TaxID=1481112 RepID=A0A023W536_9CAUD|nr:hypothetical protein FF83_gp200 [Serratia phage PS2]AHY25454.1 hypothetical protein PS2_215 [Serratia phage PS2]
MSHLEVTPANLIRVAQHMYNYSELDDLMFISEGAISVNRNKLYSEMDEVADSLKIGMHKAESECSKFTHAQTITIISELFAQMSSDFQKYDDYTRNLIIATLLVQPGDTLYGWVERWPNKVRVKLRLSTKGAYACAFTAAVIAHSDNHRPEIKAFDLKDMFWFGNDLVFVVEGKREEIEQFRKPFTSVVVDYGTC